jgi:hypothetical protein
MVADISKDYAGYKEKEGQNDPLFFSVSCHTAEKQGKLNDRQFLRLMNQYLVTLQDRNLKFVSAESETYQPSTCGFRVRSYQGHLYVTQAEEENRVQPGDEILAIDMTLPAMAKRNFQKNFLGADVEERELWGPIFKMAKKVTVKHRNGTDSNITLKQYPAKRKLPKLGGHLIGKDTLYLDLPHFAEEEAMEKLLAAKEKSLLRCKKLILDLRHNIGGTENVFVPLLDYIFPEPVYLRDLYEEKGLYTNYTESNCRRKAEMLENFLPEADDRTRVIVESMVKELRQKSGQGMVWEEDQELLADETKVGGKGKFEKIIILSDTYCEYAGETFIELCKKSPKVKVLGRPTMGNIDYCNPVSIDYDGKFVFTYPMSKTKAAAEGRGVSGKGVPVDIYVPFSPVECVRDTLLTRAERL